MNKVESVGDSYVIKNLQLTDQNVVASLRAAEQEHIDLGDHLSRVISIGIQALIATGVNLGVGALSDAIAGAKSEIAELGKESTNQLKVVIEEVAGNDGTLSQIVRTSLDTFSKSLQEMTSGEKSPIREGIQNQIAQFGATLTSAVKEAGEAQSARVARMLNSDDAESPLHSLADKLVRLETGLQNLKAEVSKDTAVQAALENTALSGVPYEMQVISALQKITYPVGDTCIHTGGTSGLKGSRSYKGDGVVELKEGGRVVARIVIESKNTAVKKEKWISDEVLPAKENRDAIAFLGFSKYLGDMPNGGRVLMIDPLTWLIAYDPEIDHPETLFVVYQMLRTNALVAAGSLSDDAALEVTKTVEESVAMLNNFDQVVRNAGTAAKMARDVADALGPFQRELLEKFNEITRRLKPELQSIDITQVQPLELDDSEV
jgi:hypothetical protein